MALSDARLQHMAGRLVEVSGVVGVLLGGSRARGDHTPDSDTDLGLYYRPPLDLAALRDVARGLAGPDARLTEAVDVLVAGLLEQREQARAAKDFATADAIRDRIKAAGIEIEDTPSGPKWTVS